MPTVLPYVPQNITVHLGAPNQAAANVSVPFISYIKNVASSEIYPTWPESSLRANIYAIITFALNRIYTEWYRSRGYDFDITNSTQYDQAFVNGRDFFENISRIVDEIFNDYVVRQGFVQPLFTQFCNGTTVTCDGLSQWGTVDLAEQGYGPYEILQYYYGNDIDIVRDAPILAPFESYPGRPLRIGSIGNEVYTIQNQLNRIARNYPAIPTINNPNGTFDLPTQEAVLDFQRIFNLVPDGVVGKATWYKIKYIFTSVTRLAELTSEGLQLQDVEPIYPTTLRLGDRNLGVGVLQLYLDTIGYFNGNIPIVVVDGIFGPRTQEAVIAFQNAYDLTPDGIVGRNTWNTLQDAYVGIIRTLPEGYQGNHAKAYPGYPLSFGMDNQDVRDLQTYISTIAKNTTGIPDLPVTGYYGPQTENAVRLLQRRLGIPEDGIVNPLIWTYIGELYNDVIDGIPI